MGVFKLGLNFIIVFYHQEFEIWITQIDIKVWNAAILMTQ